MILFFVWRIWSLICWMHLTIVTWWYHYINVCVNCRIIVYGRDIFYNLSQWEQVVVAPENVCKIKISEYTLLIQGGGFNARVNRRVHFMIKSQRGWGSGKGRVKGGEIRRLIHVVTVLTLRRWCFCVAPRLLRVESSQACSTRNIVYQCFNYKFARDKKKEIRNLVTSLLNFLTFAVLK